MPQCKLSIEEKRRNFAERKRLGLVGTATPSVRVRIHEIAWLTATEGAATLQRFMECGYSDRRWYESLKLLTKYAIPHERTKRDGITTIKILAPIYELDRYFNNVRRTTKHERDN